jgi:hypothetical protein
VKRVVQALLAAGFVVFAVLALFVGRPARQAENRIDLASRPGGPAAFREEATLRNVTKNPIAYTIKPGPGGGALRARALAVGAVDRLATDLPVEIAFDSGRRTTVYLVHPGRPYSFRYDEKGVIRIYPGRTATRTPSPGPFPTARWSPDAGDGGGRPDRRRLRPAGDGMVIAAPGRGSAAWHDSWHSSKPTPPATRRRDRPVLHEMPPRPE